MFIQLNQADEFIREKTATVDTTYRHHYHLMAPIGWINDPNGFVYYKGEYHLFYQYYPYDSSWGPMHWGHAKTKDLIHWEHLPVALAPSEDYDIDGCFSGSAIEKDGKLYLMYTGHVENNDFKREVQCMAVSEDGIHFEKYVNNPVIDERQISGIAAIEDFRDPKVFQKGDEYYTVVASKTADERGEILLFKSSDLLNWEYFSVLLEGDKTQGIMWECPDLFELDGKDVLIMSPIKMQKQGISYHNTNSTVAFIGKMNWETGQIAVENYHEIDYGLDFYAPQTCEDANGQRIMVAWMQMWNRTMPSHDLGHGWTGAMTLPRVLHVRDNQLIQEPIGTIYKSLSETKTMKDIEIIDSSIIVDEKITDSHYVKMVFDVTKADALAIYFAKIDNQYLLINYNVENQLLTINREHIGKTIAGVEDTILVERQILVSNDSQKLEIEIFRDTVSVEIFVNDGQASSFTFYEEDKGSIVEISAENQLKLLEYKSAEIKV